MRYEFDVLFDKITSLDSPGYSDKEVSVFLTKAQDIFIKSGYNPFSSIEQNDRRRREFVELKKNYTTSTPSTTQTGVNPNGYFFDLPSDFMLPLKEEVTIASSNDCTNGTRIPIRVITEDEYTIQLYNPFKRPEAKGLSTDFAWRLDFSQSGNKRIELISDGTFTFSTYHLRYLKQAQDIIPIGDGTTLVQQDCELDSLSHREIVDMAVRIASGATASQEYQIKVNEERINN
jgi:hypothetical protein